MLTALLIALPLTVSAPAHAGASITVEDITVDGVTVKTMQCELTQGGLMAGVSVVSALAGQKSALDACAPAGGAYKVGWTWTDGETASVAVTEASAPDTAACVNSALKAINTGVTGTCTALLLVGDAAGAEAASGALKPVDAAGAK